MTTVGGEDERIGWWHLPSSVPAPGTIPYNVKDVLQYNMDLCIVLLISRRPLLRCPCMRPPRGMSAHTATMYDVGCFGSEHIVWYGMVSGMVCQTMSAYTATMCKVGWFARVYHLMSAHTATLHEIDWSGVWNVRSQVLVTVAVLLLIMFS